VGSVREKKRDLFFSILPGGKSFKKRGHWSMYFGKNDGSKRERTREISYSLKVLRGSQESAMLGKAGEFWMSLVQKHNGKKRRIPVGPTREKEKVRCQGCKKGQERHTKRMTEKFPPIGAEDEERAGDSKTQWGKGRELEIGAGKSLVSIDMEFERELKRRDNRNGEEQIFGDIGENSRQIPLAETTALGYIIDQLLSTGVASTVRRFRA